MRTICTDAAAQYAPIIERDVIPLLVAAGHEFTWHEGTFADPQAAIAAAAGYDGLYVLGDRGPIPSGMFRANPALRHVSFVGTGATRFVDMAEAEECGVPVTNVADFASQSVAEMAIALMFAVARRIPDSDRMVRRGQWHKRQGIKLAGSTLGIVGAGAIGRRVASMANGLGMSVAYWARSASPELDELGAPRLSLPELFDLADVVSIHVALNDETVGLVDAELLDRLKPTAILVNTARSEIVDTVALRRLLAEGRIFGAGLDVFDAEPPTSEEIPSDGINVVLSPHVGFHTAEADEVFRRAAENTVAFAAGRPVNVVTA